MSVIVIPMAGASSRFYNAGYSVPKYMLPLGKETVFDKAVKSFEPVFDIARFVFVIRKDDKGASDFVNVHAKDLGIENYSVVELEQITKGQAETVMEGLYSLNLEDLNEPLFVFNIDTIRKNLNVSSIYYTALFDAFEDPNADEKKWSFCALDKGTFNVIETAEKRKISNYCSTGLYIFKSCWIYQWLYNKAVKEDENYNYYIAPLYNYIPDKSKSYMLYCPREDVEFSGVPEEYENLKLKYKNEEKID